MMFRSINSIPIKKFLKNFTSTLNWFIQSEKWPNENSCIIIGYKFPTQSGSADEVFCVLKLLVIETIFIYLFNLRKIYLKSLYWICQNFLLDRKEQKCESSEKKSLWKCKMIRWTSTYYYWSVIYQFGLKKMFISWLKIISKTFISRTHFYESSHLFLGSSLHLEKYYL